MSNIFSNAYEKLDDQIMKGVNASVRAYNWTTGKTKADLANKLLTIAPIAESTGFIGMSYNNPFLLPISLSISGAMMFISHDAQERNKETDMLEQKSLEDSCLDYIVELRKEVDGRIGPVWAITAVFQGAMGATRSNDNLTGYLVAGGSLVRSASHYVMRADYLPPRKSAVKKGLEKLAEIIEEYKPPVFQPAPVPAV